MKMLNKLHNRIMLPFMVLFVVINLAPLLLYRYYIGHLIDQRTAVQSDRISRLISNSGFVQNPVYLERLRKVIDSDIIVYQQAGRVVASTMKGSLQMSLESQVSPEHTLGLLTSGQAPLFQQVVRIDRDTFMLTARFLEENVSTSDRLMLWVISPMSDAQAAKSSLTVLMVFVCLGGIIVTFVFGRLIARSVTRPVGDLVAVTQKAADGDFGQRAKLPTVEELRRLAASINMMSEKLIQFETQTARSSRLAAAGKVTAAMSHEIRNPLSSVNMLAQLLRDGDNMTDKDERIIHAMLEEIARLERIVGDISDVLRPSRLERRLQDIQVVIGDVLLVLEPKMKHRKIGIAFTPNGDLPELSIDKDKIKQVLWNLLLNAMESMPMGGNISVTALRDRLQNQVHIKVEDEGCGLDGAEADEIFTPFYTTKPEGLGLGLSTSREIMSGHGGMLVLENRAGAGARAIMIFSLGQ